MKNKFRKEESVNAILYVIECLGGVSDMHKICKVLYFADQKHLSRYGRCVTGDVYIAMQYGPVPSMIDDIFKAVRGDSYFSGAEFERFFRFQNKYMVQAMAKPDMDYLSETDVECLDYAVALCRDKTFGQLTDMSHGMAYCRTSPDRTMSFKDILREEGDDEEYIDYIHQKMELEAEVFA